MSKPPSHIKNFTYVCGSGVAPFFVTLLTLPLLIDTVGLQRYGLLAICWMVTGYVNFLQLGMGRAVVQRINASRQMPPDQQITARSAIVSSALLVTFCAGLLAAAIAAFSFQIYTASFDVAGTLTEEITAGLPWMGIAVLGTFISGTFQGLLQADERFGAYAAFRTIGVVGIQIAPLGAAIVFGPNFSHLLLAVAIIRIATPAAMLWFLRTDLQFASTKHITKESLSDLFSFGGWVSLIGIIGPLLIILDRLAIGAVSGATTVGLYTVAYNLCNRLLVFPNSLGNVLLPRFSRSEKDIAANISSKALNLITMTMTPMLVIFVFAYEPFVSIWINATIASESVTLAAILSVGVWAHSVTQSPYMRLVGEGRVRTIAFWYIAQAPFYCGLMWYALTTYGTTGAALVWSTRMVIDAIVFLTLSKTPATRNIIFGSSILMGASCVCSTVTTTWPKYTLGLAILAAALCNSAITANQLGIPARINNKLRRKLSPDQCTA